MTCPKIRTAIISFTIHTRSMYSTYKRIKFIHHFHSTHLVLNETRPEHKHTPFVYKKRSITSVMNLTNRCNYRFAFVKLLIYQIVARTCSETGSMQIALSNYRYEHIAFDKQCSVLRIVISIR